MRTRKIETFKNSLKSVQLSNKNKNASKHAEKSLDFKE